jgi:hypothetical protein
MNLVKVFLQKMIISLNKIAEVDSAEMFLSAMKIISDSARIFVEVQQKINHKKFKNIYDYLIPSSEEINSRYSYEEIDLHPQRAVTRGIGRNEGELISTDKDPEYKFFRSGKSLFAGVNIQVRFRILAKKNDVLYNNIQVILQKSKSLQESELKFFQEEVRKPEKEYQDWLEGVANDFGKSLSEIFKNANGEAKALSLVELAQRYKPSSSKLADKAGVPMVAAISSSAARLLITLHELGIFETNGRYDLDKIQIFSNVIAAVYGQDGHHSFTEVAESYNRLLDYILLSDNRKKLPQSVHAKLGFIQAATTIGRLQLKHVSVEDALGRYYRYGDYESFLHHRFQAKKVDNTYVLKKSVNNS